MQKLVTYLALVLANIFVDDKGDRGGSFKEA